MHGANVRWAHLQAGLSCFICCMSCGALELAVLLMSRLSSGSLSKAGRAVQS